jgi:hypothetical protein
MDDDYALIVVVVPKTQFEDIVSQVENWALIGPDHQTFDEASGRMGLIEDNWSLITD